MKILSGYYSIDIIKLKSDFFVKIISRNKVIVLYGVNDLNIINSNSEKIIEGYKQIIQKDYERNSFIDVGTIVL